MHFVFQIEPRIDPVNINPLVKPCILPAIVHEVLVVIRTQVISVQLTPLQLFYECP